MRVPTAVPKTFAASLAPKDQPKKSPPSKNTVIVASTEFAPDEPLAQMLRLMA